MVYTLDQNPLLFSKILYLLQKEESTAAVDESVKRDLSALSPKELAALFRQQNPEFDGIVLDF